jgi:MoaA/NifB/PqqE/SkfB family radical SAM enzyme
MDPRRKGWRAYANWVRSYCEYLAGASRIKARPLKLIFDPTNVCQLACPLCPTGAGILDRARGHAELDMFRRVMEEVGAYVFFVDFYNWGEPLLSPRLEEFIAIAKIKTHIFRRLICFT